MPPDQQSELLHAILYRKGLRTIRREIGSAEPTGSLAERVSQIFDTKEE
jgi:hypothetical protein